MDYQKEVLITESNDMHSIRARLLNNDMIRLLHASQGIATEGGEFTDTIKKHIFYGRPLDKLNLIEELGDVLWYVAVACDALGTNIDDVMQRNIAKLRTRYSDNFTPEEANDRDPFHELSAMEGN